MGASDGIILGITKIFDSGLPSDRWNLVLVGEGYTASEQAQFQQDAQDLLDELLNTTPFDEDEIACAINVYRLDVESDESGADDPDCDGAGAGTSVDTYFDATFCDGGINRRSLGGNGTLVQDTVEDVFPYWHQIVVIVNSAIRGGTGGTIAWSSTGGFDWLDVFIHELGHAAFGLADEYDYVTNEPDEEGQDNYPGGEPSQPNVTAEPDPTSVKWSSFVTAGPDVPTHDNPDCGETNTGPSPVTAGTVGTFEGAYYYHCDAYRPQYECKMRSTGDDFCAVCLNEIRNFFATYALPSVSGGVTLDTPTVIFNNIPEGSTTQRAATFAVESCVSVTFQVTSGPSVPFELASSTTVVSSPTGPSPWKAYIWFRYSCDSPGTTHDDQVTIECLETGEVFTIDLTGNCVTRPNAAVQLVFDKSGSMLDHTDEGRTKEQILKDAAHAFNELLYDDNGVGLNAYDHDPDPILNIQQAGEPGSGLGRDQIDSEISSFSANPLGLTAIGDGIELAKSRLDMASSYDEKAMIVLTDGIETADKRVEDVADTVVNQKVFAIGLGTSSQIEPSTLNALTNGTGGYLLMTGNLSSDDTFLLSKYYLQILAGVNNNDIILDPDGYVRGDRIVRIPFDVVESDLEITGTILSKAPKALRFALETPDGELINEGVAFSEPTVSYRSATQTVFIRASLPQVLDGKTAHAGQWYLRVGLDEKYYHRHLSQLKEQQQNYSEAVAHGVKYSANVYTYSNLHLQGQILQDSYEPGANLTIRAKLIEYDVPFEGYASVRGDIQFPDSSQKTIELHNQEPGIYQADFVADQAGVYRVQILASGRTNREEPFTREQIVTAPIWHGGDNPTLHPTQQDEKEICQIINCLLKSGALNEKTRKWFDKYGIDLEQLAECLCSQYQDKKINSKVISRKLTNLRDQLKRIIDDDIQID